MHLKRPILYVIAITIMVRHRALRVILNEAAGPNLKHLADSDFGMSIHTKIGRRVCRCCARGEAAQTGTDSPDDSCTIWGFDAFPLNRRRTGSIRMKRNLWIDGLTSACLAHGST